MLRGAINWQNRPAMSKRGCRSGAQQLVGGSLQGIGSSWPANAADDFPAAFPHPGPLNSPRTVSLSVTLTVSSLPTFIMRASLGDDQRRSCSAKMSHCLISTSVHDHARQRWW
jgi:hypothetical protein